TPGVLSMAYTAQAAAALVVSYPAAINVTTWSRISRSLNVSRGVILAMHQRRQHVVVRIGRLKPRSRDLVGDAFVDPGASGHRAPPLWRGQSLFPGHGLRQVVDQVQQRLQLCPEKLRFRGQPLSEQRLDRAASNRGTELLVDVDPVSGAPSVDDGVRVLRHDRQVVLDLSMVQSRLH